MTRSAREKTMDQLELTRKETGPSETIGILTLNKQIECLILEPPKWNNEKGKSCIPTGRYYCEVYFSKRYHCECLALHNVPGREYICSHPGNTHLETEGCLLPGMFQGHMEGRRAVKRSRDALHDLLGKIKTGKCWMTIREDF